MKLAIAFATGVLLAAPPAIAQTFVNWESPHVSPIDLTPDGSLLLAVNTADNRLEVFTVSVSGLVALGSVPVGLDPVSVRARTNTEAWVVNHISDTVSIVDLVTMNVTGTLYPGDEPADVVFAGTPTHANLWIRHWQGRKWVYYTKRTPRRQDCRTAKSIPVAQRSGPTVCPERRYGTHERIVYIYRRRRRCAGIGEHNLRGTADGRLLQSRRLHHRDRGGLPHRRRGVRR